jgi:hypothetical protein
MNFNLQILSYEAPSTEYSTIRQTTSSKEKKRVRVEEEDEDYNDVGESGVAETGKINVCVKQKPWDLVLGGDGIDFRKVSISATLLLHASSSPVETRSIKPLSFSVRPTKSGEQCVVEVRLNVLSSQLEHSLFSIRFTAGESSVISEPIRVVSKKSQLEKSAPKRSRTTQVATRDAVLAMMDKMDEQQAMNQAMMQSLMKQNRQMVEALKKSGKGKNNGFCEMEEDSSSIVIQQEDQSVGGSFVGALKAVLAAYRDTPLEERMSLVHQFSNLTSQEKSSFEEIVALVNPTTKIEPDFVPSSMPLSFDSFKDSGRFVMGKSIDNIFDWNM